MSGYGWLVWAAKGPSACPSGTAYAVLVALAERANDAGEAWPEIASLAEQTGFGERAVRRALAALESSSVIVAVDRRPGTRTRWRLNRSATTGGATPVAKTPVVETQVGETAVLETGVPRSERPTPPVGETGDPGRRDRRSAQPAQDQPTLSLFTSANPPPAAPKRPPPKPRSAAEARRAVEAIEVPDVESDHARFTRWWSDAYAAATGNPYTHAGAKDGTVVSRLLKNFPVAELIRRASRFLTLDDDQWITQTDRALGVFARCVNQPSVANGTRRQQPANGSAWTPARASDHDDDDIESLNLPPGFIVE